MTKRMLIDSTHAEETRVVVLDGNRLEEFDLETSTKHQLKGNIYLAKIVRVEPSLQAAFVEYGGNRHGFLAFGEIHPDYYQIPVADRKRLLEAQEQEAREDEEAAEREAADVDEPDPDEPDADGPDADGPDADEPDADEPDADEPDADGPGADGPGADEPDADGPHAEGRGDDGQSPTEPTADAGTADASTSESAPSANDPGHQPIVPTEDGAIPVAERIAQPMAVSQEIMIAPDEAATMFPAVTEDAGSDMAPEAAETGREPDPAPASEASQQQEEAALPPGSATDSEAPAPEQIGGELDNDDQAARRTTPRFLRHYKIQEVMRRRQILLVQVVKEERGGKGAALTTYISLAGRFSVLMPNSPRGGGISRKITSAADRRRLKEVTTELDLPRGMGLIVRTAGANRPKPEILRDCEYLLGQWDQIRDLTMKSMAPALIYEEANLIKRAIRDVYSRDVDEILVDGDNGWRAARDFMRMLMPTHARKVQLWKDPQPLFAKAQVEQQLEGMLTPTVQLKSGGYLVINQTEALVAIDVNSGRSTRERGIEETALRTNLEAAEEAARQLRLRDLAGLIVIDFIDMESRRNVASVERRLKEALKQDRARIQVGSISHFGLLEMSRQRLRPSLTETNFVLCPHCDGSGHVRSTESAALAALRAIEEEGGKRRAAEIVVHCPSSVALYILNHKRQRLAEVEARHAMLVTFVADDTLLPPALRIERMRAQVASETPPPIQPLPPPEPFEDPDEIEAEADSEAEGSEADAEAAADAEPTGESKEEGEQRRGRRRRRRRGGKREDAPQGDGEPEAVAAPQDAASDAASPSGDVVEAEAGNAEVVPADVDATAEAGSSDTEDGERRRRGRRGGRRRRRDASGDESVSPAAEEASDDEVAPPPAYLGPTPADPFAGASAFDIFESIEQAEEARAAAAAGPAASLPSFAIAQPTLEARNDATRSDTTRSDTTRSETNEVPVPEPIDPAPPTLEPESQLEPELPPAPIIMPVLIGAEAPPSEKKRGWWRR